MKVYTSSGIEMDVVENDTGGYDINIICPPKTYNSIEEGQKDKEVLIYETLTTLDSKGILGSGNNNPQSKTDTSKTNPSANVPGVGDMYVPFSDPHGYFSAIVKDKTGNRILGYLTTSNYGGVDGDFLPVNGKEIITLGPSAAIANTVGGYTYTEAPKELGTHKVPADINLSALGYPGLTNLTTLTPKFSSIPNVEESGQDALQLQPLPTDAQAPTKQSITTDSDKKNVMDMTISERGKDFIASWEQGPNGGPALEIYDDKNKDWQPGEPVTGTLTIGYGHKILGGEDYSKGITTEQAEALLISDIKTKAIDPIRKLAKVPISQQLFDALVSYVYNTGSLKGTKLLSDINNSDYIGAVKEMDINTSGGEYMQGLENRRDAEHNIANNGTYVNH